MNRQELIMIVTVSTIFSCIATVLEKNRKRGDRRQ